VKKMKKKIGIFVILLLSVSAVVRADVDFAVWICCTAPLEDGGETTYCDFNETEDVQPVLSAALYYWISNGVHIDTSGGPGSITCGPAPKPVVMREEAHVDLASWAIYVESLHLDLHCYYCYEAPGNLIGPDIHPAWFMSDPNGPFWQDAYVMYAHWHSTQVGLPPGVSAPGHHVGSFSCKPRNSWFDSMPCGPE
jgi:hypothetical protein